MFKITIEAATLPELMAKLNEMVGGADIPVNAAPKASTRKPKAAPDPEPDISGEDAALQAELNEEVEPMPDTARSIVDGGTGQPIVPEADTAPVQMTKADVKAAAVKLAGKDTPALAAILKKYDAANLSGVPDAKLGDFAADVMKALG